MTTRRRHAPPPAGTPELVAWFLAGHLTAEPPTAWIDRVSGPDGRPTLRLVVLDLDVEALRRLMSYVAPGRIEQGDGGATYTASGTANVAHGLGNLWPRLPVGARAQLAAGLAAAGVANPPG